MAVIILIKGIFLQHSLSVITFNTQHILALIAQSFFFFSLSYSLLEFQDEFSELTLDFDVKCSQNFQYGSVTYHPGPYKLRSTKCCNGLNEIIYLKQLAQNIDTLSNLVYFLDHQLTQCQRFNIYSVYISCSLQWQ